MQSGPKKLHEKAIPAHGRAYFSPGTKSALAIGLYWPCFKGVKLASKIARTVLDSPKTTLFLGLEQLFLIYSVDNSVVRSLVYMCSSLSHVCLDNWW